MTHTSALLAGLAAILSAAPAAAAPIYPPHGLDLAAQDPAVKPGDDFFHFVNGRYQARLTIAPDRTLAGKRMEMTDRMEGWVHAILDEAARGVGAQPADVRGKVGAYYAAFMDEAAIEAAGARPLAPELDAIRGAADRSALAALAGTPGFFATPFGVDFRSDMKQPTVYATYLGQSGLLLPDRDYYLTDAFKAQRAAYHAYIAKALALIGWKDPDTAADGVLAFETKIAEASWNKVQERDLTTQYNPMTPAQLAAYAPGFDWPRFLAAAGLDTRRRLIVSTNTSIAKIAGIWSETPLETLKAWEAFRIVDTSANYLSKDFVDAWFALHGATLGGQKAVPVRWKRGMLGVSGGDCAMDPSTCTGTIGFAVGELYTARYFPAETKANITELVGYLKSVFRKRIAALEWMGPATKAEALRKLDNYVVKVGYPDRPRDYSALLIRRDDLVGNARRTIAFDYDFRRKRSDGPVDPNDWLMTPQTNDAYNDLVHDIVFPAGFLQAPMFDGAADPAYNYGAIGAVIGHEMTHGFDDQGRTIDAAGALRDWWTPADAAAFKARAQVLGRQYARYEPLPGLHINPDLTMGENLSDLGGLSIALQAYHESLRGKPAPIVDGLSGDQRVLMGWAQAWSGKATPDAIRRQTQSDPHSYRPFRVNGVVRNIDAWYDAFEVKPGDALYVAPKDRARIW